MMNGEKGMELCRCKGKFGWQYVYNERVHIWTMMVQANKKEKRGRQHNANPKAAFEMITHCWHFLKCKVNLISSTALKS